MRVPDKPVVYTIIDGLSTTAFEQACASGKAPALSFLKESGRYVRDCVAVFPTITPAATASLVTGETPAGHGIPGMCWYDRDAQRFVNYGQSPRAAVIEGVSQIVQDVLVNLNERHLRPGIKTLHESLDDMGLVTASVNYMVFRGPHRHRLRKGVVKRLLFRSRLPDRIYGPKEHYFADVVEGSVRGPCNGMLSKRGLEERTKATDAWAACVTRELLERRAADLIVFYLHENDHLSHRRGPQEQVANLERADRHIAYVLDAFPSWEAALANTGWVVTSDHSQSPVGDDEDHVVALEEILEGFSRVEAGRGKERFGNADIACAGNGRAGFVYLNESRREVLLERVAGILAAHPATDQVMWRDGDSYVVDSPRGRVRFWSAEENGVVDERGHKWGVEGEAGAVGGVIEGDEIRTPEYPLALWRIQSALDLDRIGDVVATPKLTYAFTDLGGADHRGGGDHASLHHQDSIVPFLSTLDDPPLRAATVDVCPHIVGHFARRRR